MADLLDLLLRTFADVFEVRRWWAVVAWVAAMAILGTVLVVVSLGR